MGMALANAYGLIFVVCFMGHGLVDVPKRTWFRANNAINLRYLEFVAPTYRDNLDDAELDMADEFRVIFLLLLVFLYVYSISIIFKL
jgi:hypothetical protein